MKIVNLSQRSTSWLVYRNSGIGSSDIAAIMGLNPYSTPLKVYKEKMGFSNPKVSNFAMNRGVEFEEEALSRASSALGVELLPICVEDDSYPWMRASIDGYNEEQNLIVEVKIPLEKNFALHCISLEDMYRCQTQWQMSITVGRGCVYVYSPEQKSGVIWEVDIDKAYQKSMREIAIDFWTNHVLIGEPPQRKKK